MSGFQHRIALAPHCSLTPQGAWLTFAVFGAGVLTVSGVVAAQGFWPVLPFAGLELALLGWALRHSMQRRHRRQTITISEQRVLIAAGPSEAIAADFPRHWARVNVQRAHSRLHPSRLLIESQGRACEVGDFLTEEERRQVAAELARLIGPMNASPPLPAELSDGR